MTCKWMSFRASSFYSAHMKIDFGLLELESDKCSTTGFSMFLIDPYRHALVILMILLGFNHPGFWRQLLLCLPGSTMARKLSHANQIFVTELLCFRVGFALLNWGSLMNSWPVVSMIPIWWSWHAWSWIGSFLPIQTLTNWDCGSFCTPKQLHKRYVFLLNLAERLGTARRRNWNCIRWFWSQCCPWCPVSQFWWFGSWARNEDYTVFQCFFSLMLETICYTQDPGPQKIITIYSIVSISVNWMKSMRFSKVFHVLDGSMELGQC